MQNFRKTRHSDEVLFQIKTKYHFLIRCLCFGLSTFPLLFSYLVGFTKFTISPYIYIYIYIYTCVCVCVCVCECNAGFATGVEEDGFQSSKRTDMAFVNLFNSISTSYGLFNAKIRLFCKCLLVNMIIFSMFHCIFFK